LEALRNFAGRPRLDVRVIHRRDGVGFAIEERESIPVQPPTVPTNSPSPTAEQLEEIAQTFRDGLDKAIDAPWRATFNLKPKGPWAY